MMRELVPKTHRVDICAGDPRVERDAQHFAVSTTHDDGRHKQSCTNIRAR